MPQTHEIEQIIQQLRSEDPDAEAAYLGIFYDEQNSEHWYIKANQAGLRKYAADLLAASTANSDSTDSAVPGISLGSSWLDETGDA